MSSLCFILILPIALVFGRAPRLDQQLGAGHRRRERIRCPVCAWQPSKGDAWCCTPDGCGHVWNTFETRALCPGCSKQWTRTECLRCHASSPHEAWYEADDE